MKTKYTISYNAPVTLTYSFICAIILLANAIALKIKPETEGLVSLIFTAPGAPFDWKSISAYVRLFTHVFGHTDWNHFIGNFSFIILLGPLMEEKYGSRIFTLMMVITTFVTGLINACMIPYPLLGGSGIVFMLIVLSSISTLDKKQIPLSFICVVLIYFGREIYNGVVLHISNVSLIAHIAGGFCGSLFGFLIAPKSQHPKKEKVSEEVVESYSPQPKTEENPVEVEETEKNPF